MRRLTSGWRRIPVLAPAAPAVGLVAAAEADPGPAPRSGPVPPPPTPPWDANDPTRGHDRGRGRGLATEEEFETKYEPDRNKSQPSSTFPWFYDARRSCVSRFYRISPMSQRIGHFLPSASPHFDFSSFVKQFVFLFEQIKVFLHQHPLLFESNHLNPMCHQK